MIWFWELARNTTEILSVGLFLVITGSANRAECQDTSWPSRGLHEHQIVFRTGTLFFVGRNGRLLLGHTFYKDLPGFSLDEELVATCCRISEKNKGFNKLKSSPACYCSKHWTTFGEVQLYFIVFDENTVSVILHGHFRYQPTTLESLCCKIVVSGINFCYLYLKISVHDSLRRFDKNMMELWTLIFRLFGCLYTISTWWWLRKMEMSCIVLGRNNNIRISNSKEKLLWHYKYNLHI